MGKILELTQIALRRAINQGNGKNIGKLRHASVNLWSGDLGHHKEASE